MVLDYFPCYHSYAKKCEKLTDQELGRLFRALMQFSATGQRQELAGRESIAFDFIADDIARAKENYEAKCQKNAENIAKRYATTEYDRKQTNTDVYESYQSKDKNKDKDKSKTKNTRESPARFVRPTLDDVTDYCMERGGLVDPQRWYAYYESNGWRVGKNPMKDWKAAVRTWERNGVDKPKQDQPKSFADMWREEQQRDAI